MSGATRMVVRGGVTGAAALLLASHAHADWVANVHVAVSATNGAGVEWDTGGLPDLKACLVTPSSPKCDVTTKGTCNDSLVCSFRGPVPNGPFTMYVYDSDTLSNELIGSAQCDGTNGAIGDCTVSGSVAEARTVLPTPALADGRYCYAGSGEAAGFGAVLNVQDAVATVMLYATASDGGAFLFDLGVTEDGLVYEGRGAVAASSAQVRLPIAEGKLGQFHQGPCLPTDLEEWMEVSSTVREIAATEAKYDAEHDGFIAAGTPLGPKGAASLGNAYKTWNGGSTWTSLGWGAGNRVRATYWVTVPPTKDSYVVHGAIDLNGDGCATHVTLEKDAEPTTAKPIGTCP